MDKLEQGNVAASPKKTKKKILSDDEVNFYIMFLKEYRRDSIEHCLFVIYYLISCKRSDHCCLQNKSNILLIYK